eukprot:5415348-Alexandrium_andersonii.AAC.1
MGGGALRKRTRLGGAGTGAPAAPSSMAAWGGATAGGGGGPVVAGTDRARPPGLPGIALAGAWQPS